MAKTITTKKTTAKQPTAKPFITVLDAPVTKKEYKQRAEKINDFITAHNAKLRTLLDTIGRIKPEEIDEQSAKAFSLAEPLKTRAFAAWEAYAWNVLVRPYDHPNRSYHVNLDSYLKVIEKDPETLYLFGIACAVEPSEEIYKKLKTLHPKNAAQYMEYCKDYAVANKELDGYPWITHW